MPRHRVARVRDHAQVREHVLDVRRLDELEAAALDERDVGRCSSSSRSKEWKLERKSTAISSSGTPSSRSSRMRWADEARLAALVARADQHRALPRRRLRAQHLRVLLRRAVDDRVGEVEDRLRRAVVLLERDDPRAGEELREVHDVAEVGAAEGVDALASSPTAMTLSCVAASPRTISACSAVGVLVLVDHDVAVGAREPLGDVSGTSRSRSRSRTSRSS